MFTSNTLGLKKFEIKQITWNSSLTLYLINKGTNFMVPYAKFRKSVSKRTGSVT